MEQYLGNRRSDTADGAEAAGTRRPDERKAGRGRWRRRAVRGRGCLEEVYGMEASAVRHAAAAAVGREDGEERFGAAAVGEVGW